MISRVNVKGDSPKASTSERMVNISVSGGKIFLSVCLSYYSECPLWSFPESRRLKIFIPHCPERHQNIHVPDQASRSERRLFLLLNSRELESLDPNIGWWKTMKTGKWYFRSMMSPCMCLLTAKVQLDWVGRTTDRFLVCYGPGD